MGKLFFLQSSKTEGSPCFAFHLVFLLLLCHHMQTELLRLSRTNFSEAYQILVHLKVVRLFVESVLRYGLPADYVGIVLKVWLPPSHM